MVASVKPSIVPTIKYSLPEHIRLKSPKLVQFLEAYYLYLEQPEGPLNFIENILDDKDVDSDYNAYNSKIFEQMLNLIPQNEAVDKRLLLKNLDHFLRSKGSSESFAFIMRALFDEDAELEYQAPYVMNPSGNDYQYDTVITLRSDDDWNQALGTFLLQPSTLSSALVESATSLFVDGSQYWKLHISERIGEYDIDAPVQALKKTMNRNWLVVEDYYTVLNMVTTGQSVDTHSLYIKSKVPLQSANVTGLHVHQLNTTFFAHLSGLVGAYNDNLYYYYQFNLHSVEHPQALTLADEIYFLAPELMGDVITKNDYVYGTVTPTVSRIDMTSRGALYKESLPLHIRANNGQTGTGTIDFINSGKVDSIEVISGGYGYTVGDEIQTIGLDPNPLTATVSTIDGHGAAVSVTMEADTVTIENGGYGYQVNDKVYLEGEPTIELNVTSVNNSVVTGLGLSRTGSFTETLVPYYARTLKTQYGEGLTVSLTYKIKSLALTDAGHHYRSATTVLSGGHGEGASFTPNIVSGTVNSVAVVLSGSGYTYAQAVIKNPYEGTSCALTPILAAGQITGFTIDDPGYNYALVYDLVQEEGFKLIDEATSDYIASENPVIQIIGDGSGARGAVTGISDNCVRSVRVDAQGIGYGRNATLTIAGGAGAGAVLAPVVDSYGKITSVTVSNQGSNYTGTITTTLGGYTAPTLTTVLHAGDGSIIDAVIDAGGTGYWDPTERTPCKVRASGTGKGAQLTPVLDAGKLIKVNVLNCGYGYDVNTVVIVTGTGTLATCRPRIGPAGEIQHVDVVTQGSGYLMGTSVVITGDGYSAHANAIVETGVVSVDVLNQPLQTWTLCQEINGNNDLWTEAGETITFDTGLAGGMYYQLSNIIQEDGTRLYAEEYDTLVTDRPTTTITVSDPTGTGCVVAPVIDPESGFITAVNVIAKGTGYTAPTYTISPDFGQYSAVLRVNVPRYIKGFDWQSMLLQEDGSFLLDEVTGNQLNNTYELSHGLDYDTASILIQGEGYGAKATPLVQDNGSIASMTATSGAGFTSVPLITVQDNSGYGSVSSVAVKDGGTYKALPHLMLPIKYDPVHPGNPNYITAQGAQFAARSSSIGSIKTAKITDVTYNGAETPWVIFPVVVGVDNTNFIEGEKVTLKHKTDHDYMDLWNEDGSLLMSESDDVLQQTTENTFHFEGQVVDIDYPRRLVYISFNSDTATDFFNVVTEDGINVIEETGYSMVYENSAGIQEGDVLVGVTSKTESIIKFMNRASSVPEMGGTVKLNQQFLNDSGKPSHELIKLHNSKKVQNFAYIIRTGLSKNTYESVLKATVHPAGYAMYSDVMLNMDSTKDSIRGLTPLQSNALMRAMIQLFITLPPPAAMYRATGSWYMPNHWVEYNKFSMDSVAVYDYNLTGDNSEGWLTTEAGDRLISRSVVTTGGHPISKFKDWTFADVKKSKKMNWKGDSSMTVALINNR